jgi:DnaJ-domain-containing protein 1
MNTVKETKNKAPALSAEAVEARRAYYREWARKNPDKIAAKNRRFWERRAERIAEARGAAHE